MNKRQAIRLLNVARALREYQHPERFDMGCYIHTRDYLIQEDKLEGHEDWCGTPGCALGTYASRPDLQRVLRVGTRKVNEFDDNGKWGARLQPAMVLASNPSELAGYDDDEVLEHFGINDEEANELFDYDGCGEAKTPLEAAAYIERFVARKLSEQSPGDVLKNALGYTPFGQ